MSDEVCDELLCHLVIRELDPKQFEMASTALGCKRGGIDSTTKKAYLSMALENSTDWNNAAIFLEKHSKTFDNIKLSYAAFSKLTWGKFTLPNQVTDFSSKHHCQVEIQFATPPRKK